ALNQIWEVKANPKRSGILKMVLDRARGFGFVLVIGFLLLISLLLTTAISALSQWLQKLVPEFLLAAFYVVEVVFSLALITLLFALIFKYLPDVKIHWKSIWTGALVTSVLFVLGKFALGLYFGLSNPGSTYGAAGSIVLVLLWVSYSCLILFFGAE